LTRINRRLAFSGRVVFVILLTSTALTASVFVGARPAHAAATLRVTGTADGPGSCDASNTCTTLRAAVDRANAEPGGGDTIDLPAGVFTLGSQLELRASLSIRGVGAGKTVVDGNNRARVFQVDQVAHAVVSALTVRGGRVTDDAGAGILNAGSLELDDVAVAGNVAAVDRADSAGGGIANSGTLTINRGSVSNNLATLGAGIVTATLAGAGSAAISRATILGNQAEAAGGGVAVFGRLALNDATLVVNNFAVRGGGLFGDAVLVDDGTRFTGDISMSRSTVKDNVAAQFGGGIWLGNGANATITDSTLNDNVGGGPRFSGAGGGVFNNSGTLTMRNDTIAGNVASDPGGLDQGGLGGGIAQEYLEHPVPELSAAHVAAGQPTADGKHAPTSLAHAAIARVRAAGRTVARAAAPPGTAMTALDFVTIANNNACNRLHTCSPIIGGGGGIYSGGGAFQAHNSLLAGNGGLNCFVPGTITSLGYNLDTFSTCDFRGVGDQQGSDPGTLTLADNGGPTLTMTLPPGSAAFDAADPSCDVAADQRGVKRPQGSRCDIGAFELAVATPQPSSPPAPPVTGIAAAGGSSPWAPVAGVLLALAMLAMAGLRIAAREGGNV
jgi:hypothetical protein